MVSFLSRLSDFITMHNLFREQGGKLEIIVAISGGIDSTTLAFALRQMGYSIHLAHVNYQLRGAASDGDALFVEKLALLWDCPFHLHTANTDAYANDHKLSIQEAARDIRYAWLSKLQQIRSAQIQAPVYVTMAHHQDDQAESVLWNLVRGSGLMGLAGMLPDGDIQRPFLAMRRMDIYEYAMAEQLKWREDSSNETNKYTRNSIRHQVLPALEKLKNQAVEHINHTSTILQETLLELASIRRALQPMLIEPTAQGILIHQDVIEKFPHSGARVFREYLVEAGFSHADIDDMLHGVHNSAKWIGGKNVIYTAEKGFLLQEQSTNEPLPNFVIEQADVHVGSAWELPLGALSCIAPQRLLCADQMWEVPSSLAYPLVLRPWMEGDRMAPEGMSGKHKKIKDILTDSKIKTPQKQQMYVLADAHGTIHWLVGLRRAEIV